MTTISDTLRQINDATNRRNYELGRQSLGSDTLDKQAFMRLMMAKLQHQDPMDPLKDEDFLSQQAQLAQMEKLDDVANALKSNNNLIQAGHLVSKRVEVLDSQGVKQSGIVESASFDKGAAALSINGKLYTMDQITKIYGGQEG